MSVVIMTAVWQHSEAKGSTRLVLLSLADQANDDGYCWPSVGSIARRCRISERSVQDHLHVLVHALGEVVREERPGRSTVYRVLVSNGGARSAPLRDLHPAEVAPGGAGFRRGGVQDSAPRTVREPSPNPKGSASASFEASFAEFWALYPKKVSKKSAKAKYERILKAGEATAAELLAGLQQYVTYLSEGDNRNFTKDPDTWLNKGCWSDELSNVTQLRPQPKTYETPPPPDRESLPW